MSIHLHYKTEIDILCKMTISDLLNEHFLRWQLGHGNRRKLKEFSEYLGIGEVSFNQVINNRRKPSMDFVIRCAETLADERFYQAAGVMPPNKDVYYIQKNIDKLDPTHARQLREQMEKYLTGSENENNHPNQAK